jgi:thiol-disulfide isomerase/thioredoxin
MKKGLGNAVTIFLVVGVIVTVGFNELNDDLLPEGTEAPAFDLERFTGGRVTSAELKGRVVIVDFWATYCAPCRAEMPWLVEVAQEYESKGVTFIAVDEDPEEAPRLVAQFAKGVPGLERYVTYGDPFMAGKYRVEALPTLYVIGKDGKVAAKTRGQTHEFRVRRWIKAELEKEVAGSP